VILTINDEPARSPDDLRRAIQDPSRTSVVLTSTTPTGGQFRFFLPLPLGEPEMYCMGLLFDQDPKVGFHIVIGLIKNSPAEKAGIVRGCCIRKIDGSLPPLVFDFIMCQYLNICVGQQALFSVCQVFFYMYNTYIHTHTCARKIFFCHAHKLSCLSLALRQSGCLQ